MNETIAFVIGALVGIFMVLKPGFVLFKPSRKGKWLANIIGENNWPGFIRATGVLLAVLSAFFIYTGT